MGKELDDLMQKHAAVFSSKDRGGKRQSGSER
jgi:hypothetical protein